MFSNRIKIILLVTGLILILTILLALKSSNKINHFLPIPISSSSPNSIIQQPYQVLSVSPANNANNIPSGEIIVSFSSDKDIQASSSAVLKFTPQLNYSYIYLNQFPTKQIQVKVLGGLKPATTYTVNVLDNQGNNVYSWKFSTSSINKGLSSSALIQQQEQNYLQTHYPLYQFTPYTSTDFDLKYTGFLTLEVRIKSPNINLVKQEANDWIKSHGVDPTTHKINYINAF